MNIFKKKKIFLIILISIIILSLLTGGLVLIFLLNNKNNDEEDIDIIQNLNFIDSDIYIDALNGDDVGPIKHLDDGKVLDLDLSISFNSPINLMNKFNGFYFSFIDKSEEKSLSTFLNDNEDLIVFPGKFDNYSPLIDKNTFSSAEEINKTIYLKTSQNSDIEAASETNYNIKIDINRDLENINFVINFNLAFGNKFDGLNPSLYKEGISDILDNNFSSTEEVVDTLNNLKNGINNKPFSIEIVHFKDQEAII